jgi:histidine triad (HIT) family protein
MATIFTKIIKGEIPCYKIAEDDNYFAFLDINPLKAGHTLVVPKKETAIRSAISCNRIGVAILGLEVPHAHIHLVPMDTMEDVNFKKPKLKFSPEEFKEIAAKICLKVIL